DLEHLVHLVLANQLAETDCGGVLRRDHDLHPVVEDLQDVESLLARRDLTRLDADNLGHPMGRVDSQIAYAESRLHLRPFPHLKTGNASDLRRANFSKTRNYSQ